MGVRHRENGCSCPWDRGDADDTLCSVTSAKEANMPSGVFPVPKFRPSADPRVRGRPSLAVRARTRLGRKRLDERLARGADPGMSAELGWRAAQLRSSSERSRLANALVEAVGTARGPNLGAYRMKNRRRDDAIRERADDLLALAVRLRDGRTVAVRGAAMTARLISDPASPLHRADAEELRQAIQAAHAALDDETWAGSEVKAAA
jgi:hypothetical protein